MKVSGPTARCCRTSFLFYSPKSKPAARPSLVSTPIGFEFDEEASVFLGKRTEVQNEGEVLVPVGANILDSLGLPGAIRESLFQPSLQTTVDRWVYDRHQSFSALPGQVDPCFQIDVDDLCGPAHLTVTFEGRLGGNKIKNGLLVPSVKFGFIDRTGG